MNERIRVGQNKNTCPWHKINGAPKSTLLLYAYQGMRVRAIDIPITGQTTKPKWEECVAGTQI